MIDVWSYADVGGRGTFRGWIGEYEDSNTGSVTIPTPPASMYTDACPQKVTASWCGS
jgi:hypothetical protein